MIRFEQPLSENSSSSQFSKQPRAKRMAFIRPLKGGKIKGELPFSGSDVSHASTAKGRGLAGKTPKGFPLFLQLPGMNKQSL
jgi:hypothetical protein